MTFIYVIYSALFDRIYVGMTVDLERRLKQHNSGSNKSTKAHRPWVIIHSEPYETRGDARVREKYLKSFRGRSWIRNKIIKTDLEKKMD